MALKLAVANKVSVPVKFSMTDDGKVKHYAFTLTCARVSTDEFQSSIKNDDGVVTGEKIREKMTDITTGWKDQAFVLNDDDTPADFCPEALEMLFSTQGVLDAVFPAYLAAASAKTKN
jgi:hypothetical protein